MDIQVSKLRVLKQSYLSEHYDLEDRVLKYYPQTIKEYEERIAGYENDAALAEQHKPQGEDKFCPMTLKRRDLHRKGRRRRDAPCNLQGLSDVRTYRNWQLPRFPNGDLL